MQGSKRKQGRRRNKPHHRSKYNRPSGSHGAHAERTHFRKFRKKKTAKPGSSQTKAPQEVIPIAQARGVGHMRIMGKIEYDVRTILKIADVPNDQTLLYLACAREFYADFENCKPDKLEAALDNTMTKWVERGYKAEIIKRIRNRVAEIYNLLKSQTARPPRAEPVADHGPTESNPAPAS